MKGNMRQTFTAIGLSVAVGLSVSNTMMPIVGAVRTPKSTVRLIT